jgi:uncharacterized protein (TIGR03067 family)
MILLLPAIACFADDDTKKTDREREMKRLAGSWEVSSMLENGKHNPDLKTEKLVMTFRGSKFVLKQGAKLLAEGDYALDPDKTPKTLDTTATNTEIKGKTYRCIYELTGDQLKMCWSQPGQERPKEFMSKPGSGHNFAIYKRVKE